MLQACGILLHSIFYACIHVEPVYSILARILIIFNNHVFAAPALVFGSANRRYNYSFALYGDTINHYYFLPNWPIFLSTMLYFIFCVWPAHNYIWFWPLLLHILVFAIGMSTMEVHIVMSTALLMACMMKFMPVISGPYFLYGSCGITDPLCIIQDQVCIKFTHYTGECAA